MVLSRTCSFRKENGEQCRSAPMQDEKLCFWHSPEHAEEAEQARRLGGQRRRREKALGGAYELDGLDSVPSLRRVLEIVTFDALALENSVARGRLLLAAVLAGSRLLEVGEHEERLEAIEAALGPRLQLTTARGRR